MINQPSPFSAAKRIDQTDLQLARHDRRRHQPAAGDGDDALEGPDRDQAPGQRLGIAMQLFPGHGKILLRSGAHLGIPRSTNPPRF
jgi:hypothetical protein